MGPCWLRFNSNLYFLVRMALGCLFIFSGFEKLISPYQNFLFIIESYAILPSWGEEIVARGWPWIEFFLGVFLALGLWLRWTLVAVMGMLFSFVVVVAQALARHLPIDECGCFGDISFPLPVVLVFDIALALIVGFLYLHYEKTVFFSLDEYCARHERQ